MSFDPPKAINNMIALRILHMLVTPFVKTEAYRLGIIDAKGNPLKLASTLKGYDEQNAYTYLHRLVFRLKRIIEKVPVSNKQFLSYAMAFALIRENCENGEPSVYEFEGKLMTEDVEVDTETVEFVREFVEGKTMIPFKVFAEDMGGGDGGAPANNIAATPGIAMPSPPRLGLKKVITRKENEKVSTSPKR